MAGREIAEGQMIQGADEEIIYTLTTTNWGSSPTSPSVVVFDISDNSRTDVTTTVMPTNSPSVSNDVITLSPLKSLTAGKKYRVEVKFTIGSSIFETYAIVNAEN